MNLSECLDNLQREADKLYKEYGATDEVIALQVAINRFRNKYNLHDSSEELYEEFVQ